MAERLGFIGLGVMGEPMCRNLARKSGVPVVAYDVRPEPLARLGEDGVEAADGVPTLARSSDVVFVSLPGGPELESVCDGGLLAETSRAGWGQAYFPALINVVAAQIGGRVARCASTPFASAFAARRLVSPLRPVARAQR